MEIPSKINTDTNNMPSIIGGPIDYPFTQISFTVPEIPDFPPFEFEVKFPPIDINLPPIIFGQPLCISGTPFPPISFAPISITFPPMTVPSFIDLKLEPTIKEKCEAILRKLVELANEGKPIGFEQDFGGWTATITKGKMHTHVGIPGKDGSFEILVNNLYDLLIKGEGLSWV